jgi:hypothetical protein
MGGKANQNMAASAKAGQASGPRSRIPRFSLRLNSSSDCIARPNDKDPTLFSNKSSYSPNPRLVTSKDHHVIESPLPIPQASMAEQRQHPNCWRLHRRCPGTFSPSRTQTSQLLTCISVRNRVLLPHRRRRLLQIHPQPHNRPHDLHRLDPRNLLWPRHARHQ